MTRTYCSSRDYTQNTYELSFYFFFSHLYTLHFFPCLCFFFSSFAFFILQKVICWSVFAYETSVILVHLYVMWFEVNALWYAHLHKIIFHNLKKKKRKKKNTFFFSLHSCKFIIMFSFFFFCLWAEPQKRRSALLQTITFSFISINSHKFGIIH